MGTRRLLVVIASLLFAVVGSHPGYTLEKMSEQEMRQVTGFSGFISSEEDLKELEAAKSDIKGLIQRQSLEEFLPRKSRELLLGNKDLKPEQEAQLLQKTTRSLLKNPKFLKRVERTGKALAQISRALQRLQSLRN